MNNSIQTNISEVTVFQERVLVKRSGMLKMTDIQTRGNGDFLITVDDLPFLLEDETLRTEIENPGAIRFYDVRLQVEQNNITQANQSQIAQKKLASEQLEELSRQIKLLEFEIQNLAIHLNEIKTWIDTPITIMNDVKNQKSSFNPFPVNDYQDYLKYMTDHFTQTQIQIRELKIKLVKAKQDFEIQKSLSQDSIDIHASKPIPLTKKAFIRGNYLLNSGDSLETLFTISYCIPGARWSTNYSIFLDDRKSARLRIHATLSQFTGEDWHGVKLNLSTSNLLRSTQPQVLPSRRIGRRQPRPQKKWHEPPPFDKRLIQSYSDWMDSNPLPAPIAHDNRQLDYALALMQQGRQMVTQNNVISKTIGSSIFKKDSTRRTVRQAKSIPPPMAAAAPGEALTEALMDFDLNEEVQLATDAEPSMAMFAGAADSPIDDKTVAETERINYSTDPEIAPVPSIDYFKFEMGGPDDESKGRLRPIASPEKAYNKIVQTLKQEHNTLFKILSQKNIYHVFQCKGIVEIPSDGKIHTVDIDEKSINTHYEYQTAPKTDPQVYSHLACTNPFDFPLPQGPISVYKNNNFMLQTQVPDTPTQGILRIPMGVEQRIKIVRNLKYNEEEVGLISSNQTLANHVMIEITSFLPDPVTIIVIERLPVVATDERHIQIEMLKTQYQWTDLDSIEEKDFKGGKTCRVTLDPYKKIICKLSYQISFPAKLELEGGNRRE